MFEEIYKLTKRIPLGKVTTYGEIARRLNTNPRTVGWALHANKNHQVPCHRVVDRNGRIAKNYGFGGASEQYKRLQNEGVTFINSTHVDLKKYLW